MNGKIYVYKVIILDITWQGTESRKKRKEKPDKIQMQKKMYNLSYTIILLVK